MPTEQLLVLVLVVVPPPKPRRACFMVTLLSANSETTPAGGRPSGELAQTIHSQLVMMNTFPGGTTNGAVVPSGFCTVSRAMPSKALGHKCPARSDTVRRSLALFGPSPAAPERATNAGESSRATTRATMRDIRAILHRWGRGTTSGSTATCTA